MIASDGRRPGICSEIREQGQGYDVSVQDRECALPEDPLEMVTPKG